MAYKEYTRQDVANFTGRAVESFPETYVNESAIPQALLLFKIGTCLVDPSELSADDRQLVDFAILSMADAIHLAAPYQAALASPFNSETIGSYSYSKVAKAVQRGDETGVMWFDTAVQKLSVCEGQSTSFARGGIEVFDGSVQNLPGNTSYLSSSDREMSRVWGWDPSL